MTDTQKALYYLKKAGTAGVHSFDLNNLIGTTRAAARVNDLKNQGHNIVRIMEKKGDSRGARYFLIERGEAIIKQEALL